MKLTVNMLFGLPCFNGPGRQVGTNPGRHPLMGLATMLTGMHMFFTIHLSPRPFESIGQLSWVDLGLMLR